MEAYRGETREVVGCFLDHHITFRECLFALDEALARLMPRMTDEQLPALQATMFANKKTVMKEMNRREHHRNPYDEVSKLHEMRRLGS